MNLYMDSEFTNLHQRTTLISLALIAEDGSSFYAEFTDYDRSQVNSWLDENVFKHLTLADGHYSNEGGHVQICHNTRFITAELEEWLEQFEDIVIWSDCLAYDWVLFCELFGGGMCLPKNVNYIPMDICTLFHMKGIDPDVSRLEFIDEELPLTLHNAYDDAYVIKACYEKLMNGVLV